MKPFLPSLAAILVGMMAVHAQPVPDTMWSYRSVILHNPYFKCEESLSPPLHVSGGLPPVITFLGDQDQAITVESLLMFHKHLKAADNVSELYIGKGGKHGFCNGRNPKNPFFYWSDMRQSPANKASNALGNPVNTGWRSLRAVVEFLDYRDIRQPKPACPSDSWNQQGD